MTKYRAVVKGKVASSFFSTEGSSFKIELSSEKPLEFLKESYSDITSERFIPEIITKEDVKTISFHSKFEIPTSYNGEAFPTEKIGEGSKIRVKLKGTGKGIYPVAIIVEELVEKEPYNPFDF